MCIHTHVYTYMFICPCTCKTGGGGKGRRGSGPGPSPGLGRARMLSCNVSVWQKSGCRTAWIYGKWKVENGVFLKNQLFKISKNEKCKFNTVQDDEKLHLQISPKYKKRIGFQPACAAQRHVQKNTNICISAVSVDLGNLWVWAGHIYIYVYVHIHIYIYIYTCVYA